MASNWCNAGELINYSVGGGWGKEKTDNDYAYKVAIIRGADFPSIDKGEYYGLPIRWEKLQKAMNASLQEGDIVIEISGGTESRPTGRTILITKELLEAYDCPIIPASFCRLIRSKDTVNSVYFYYWLQEMYRAGRTWGYQNRSTGLSNFQYKTFCNMESVFIPEVDAQRKIASILLSFDKKRRLLTQLNDYLTVLLDALWLQACEESEERLLSEVATTLSGGTPKTSVSEYWEGGTIPFFSPKDIGSPYTLETEKYVTELGVENCNSALCPVNTVFLTARGTVGKVGLAGVPMAMNQSCFAFSGVGIDQSSVYQVIKSAVCSLKAKANGATFAAINTRDLKVETVDVPVQSRLESFQNDARGILAMMLANAKENQCLAELRDALLPKLMSGEIDVSRADLTQLNNHLVDYAMSDCVSFHFSTYR